METKVTTIENAPTVEVEAKSKANDLRMGLKAVSRRVKNNELRHGFAISIFVCKDCGEQSNLTKEDKQICSYCRGKKLHQIDYTSSNKTGKIINRTLKYKCETCGTEYDDPNTRCCLSQYESNYSQIDEKTYRGFMCLGCHHIYSKEVACCTTAKMVSGRYQLIHEKTPSGIILPA